MEKRIASPELAHDEIVREFIDKLEVCEKKLHLKEAIFYYKYPIFRDETNTLYRSKGLLATRSHGLFVFGFLSGVAIVDNSKIVSVDKELSQLDSILYGKFLRSKVLRSSKREIGFPISVAIYCPEEMQVEHKLENEIFTTPKEISDFIGARSDETTELSDDQWEELLSLLDGGKGISRQDQRDPSLYKKGSRAYALAEMEQKITNFDRFQRSAALSTPNGPQRIRGIAGSGKTIIIAKKAAQLHLEFPEKNILVTFWTKSLYELLRQQITRFYRQYSDTDPDWDKISVLHAWGGQNNAGVYYNASIANGRRPLAYRDIVAAPNKSKFGYACSDLLRFSPLTQTFDYVLIDEGQDLPESFYQLCFEICKGSDRDRNIVWAYDELQTIMETRVQDIHTTFGYLADGKTPKMDLERAYEALSYKLIPHDIVLKRSYRNPAEILVTAHALGFGIYGRHFVQMLENEGHWEDLGYEVVKGDCSKGQDTVITRPPENSPLDLDKYVGKADIIKTSAPNTFQQEIDFICEEIRQFIKDGLNPQDILVISLDDLNARNYFSVIAKRLGMNDISFNNIQDATYSIPEFFIDGKVTGSTVYKAKGNEAPVVFVVGVDAIADQLDDIRARNKIFTAFTRSRGWLRVSGLAPFASVVLKEIDAALAKFPDMQFKYPDPQEVWTIQRDLSQRASKLRELREKMLELDLTDIDPEEIAQLAHTTKSKLEKKK